jgi:excinuclease ABC subunit C
MALPTAPGVYLMKDKSGNIIYVGKAKGLKNRVSQYFGADTNHTQKVRQMVARVADFDYIVAGSEFEALVLECSLIKQYAPKYNILLKDDKGYCYIRVSPPPYSRITEVKQKIDDGARYIGPYMSSFGIKQAVDEANKVFGLSTCSRQLAYGKRPPRTERPCLNHHLGQCSQG